MRHGEYLLLIGFAFIAIGILLLMLDNAYTSNFSGVFIIFPFVFFIGNAPSISYVGLFLLSILAIFLFFVLPIFLFKYAFSEYSVHRDINYIVCPNCGNLIPSHYRYCPFCGYNLKGES